MDKIFTVEDLLSDQTFTDFCINPQSKHRPKWNAVIASHPQQALVFEESIALLRLVSPELPQSEIEAEVNKLREVLADGMVESKSFQPQPLSRRNNRAKILACGIIILLCVSGVFYLANQDRTTSHLPLASTFKTTTGERKQFILPDGSTVILNSNSSFTFDKNFGKRDRQVNLNGDAFFNVAKDPSKPFKVISNGFSTTAIGTAFYVHANPALTDFSVNLLEGKVKLENKSGETLFLAAGEKASWAKSNNGFTRERYDTISLNRWVKGILSFKNTPVQDAFAQLESWYSVDIEDMRTNPEIISINGDYMHAPLEDVLKVICFSLSCGYRFEGNKIIIQ